MHAPVFSSTSSTIAAADPERDYEVIRGELEEYEPQLLEKLTLVVANKMDLPDAREHLKVFQRARTRDGLPVVAISAEQQTGIGDLIAALGELLPNADELARPAESMGVVVHRFQSGLDAFSVQREGEAYRVVGRRIERLAAQTNFDNPESAQRFQRDLARLGVERELARAGVGGGDTVRIGGVELEWDDETGRVSERWGILGGVFDPIHLAHLAIAEQTREALDLDHVLFVPANVPVHRSPAHVQCR